MSLLRDSGGVARVRPLWFASLSLRGTTMARLSTSPRLQLSPRTSEAVRGGASALRSVGAARGAFVALLASASMAQAQSLTIAAGPDAQHLTVSTASPAGHAAVVAAAGLSGIELQPLELAGRTNFDRWNWRRPQLSAERLAPAFITLPNGAKIFAFRRTATNEFGFFALSSSGKATTLLTQPAAGGGSPFLPTVGVSSDGATMAVATTIAAGGDLILVSTSGAGSVVATAALAPIPWQETSFAFADGALFATAEPNQLWRVPLAAPTAAPVALPLSGGAAPAWIDAEIVVSGDGSTIAFFAGLEKKINDLYVGKADGTVWNRTKAPARHELPGFGPLEPLGPNVALSNDGGLVAYMRKMDEKELFVAPTGQAQTGFGNQLTQNSVFQESIGTGITVGFTGALLTFGFGGVHDTFDMFHAATPASGGPPPSTAVANTTLTGSAGAPFQDIATIVPSWATRVPGTAASLVLDQGAAPGLRVANPSQPKSAVASPAPLVVAGVSRNDVVLVAAMGGLPTLLRTEPQSFSTTPESAPVSLVPVAAMPAGAVVDRAVVSALGRFAAVSFRSGGASMLWIIQLENGAIARASIPGGARVESLAIDSAGRTKAVLASGGLKRAALFTRTGRLLFETQPFAALELLR